MSDILSALGMGAMILTPVVLFMIVVSLVAVKRGEENSHH